ncbi:hypothetical protein [Mucilaginibacter sp. 10I4]|uniref:hypothetical protein n=1 Tax=Mucilaginibacter sp. 10I4 TaxID=3048580 RepID=UPI002B22DE47|nr:hypothetical protein [Mucilaginibacter sp. 10I4]MEB0262919.1 hypothetical protein [Mucilaginibacter sp. 10I4]
MLDPNYKPYKPTGNIAVDMVASCINNYHVQGATVRVIRLDAIHWTMFKGFVLENLPTFAIEDNEIDFDGVIVTKASVLSNEAISWELKRDPKLKVYIN